MILTILCFVGYWHGVGWWKASGKHSLSEHAQILDVSLLKEGFCLINLSKSSIFISMIIDTYFKLSKRCLLLKCKNAIKVMWQLAEKTVKLWVLLFFVPIRVKAAQSELGTQILADFEEAFPSQGSKVNMHFVYLSTLLLLMFVSPPPFKTL